MNKPKFNIGQEVSIDINCATIVAMEIDAVGELKYMVRSYQKDKVWEYAYVNESRLTELQQK